MQIVMLSIIVAIAAFLQTSIGFGFAVLAVALLPLLYPYGSAIALVQAIGLVNTVSLSLRYWRSIQWRVMLPLLIPTLLFGTFFTVVSFSMETELLRIGLGVLLIILALYFLRIAGTFTVKPSVTGGAIMGVISGISNGLFGIAGPPAALYLLPAVDDTRAYLATIQMYFTLCNLVNLAFRISNGAFDGGYRIEILVGWISVAMGTLAGLWAFSHLKLLALKRVVYVFIGLNGIWIVIQQIVG